jgi:paired amphipathic helix protein Sin3a
MRLLTYLLLSFSALTQSQLVAFPVERLAQSEQLPLMEAVGPAMPPPSDAKNPYPPPARGPVILSDVMGRDKSINIFASFIRDIDSAAIRLDVANVNTTVLAPLNSAIEKLPWKPWEDPRDYGTLGNHAYDGEEGYERAQRNLRRFVEAHMVPVSPWPEKEKVKPIGDDRHVWWETKDGVKVVRDRRHWKDSFLVAYRDKIQPRNVEVVRIGSTVANGELVGHEDLFSMIGADMIQ